MRNIIAIIIGIFVLAANVAFTYDDAQAARRTSNRVCICTGPAGTKYQTCPIHRNCVGLTTHAHEDLRSRSTAIDLACVINGQTTLVPGNTTCSAARNYVRNRERAERNRERAEARQERQAERDRKNSPLNRALESLKESFDNEMNASARRAGRAAGRDAGRRIWGH